jgi:hypothetical protein
MNVEIEHSVNKAHTRVISRETGSKESYTIHRLEFKTVSYLVRWEVVHINDHMELILTTTRTNMSDNDIIDFVAEASEEFKIRHA